MSEEEVSAFESELAMVEGIFCAIVTTSTESLMNLLHGYCEEVAHRDGVPYNEVTFYQIVDYSANMSEKEQLQ